MNDYVPSGRDRLWIRMSYTGWLTMPRVMMHQMPDEWQGKMADLIDEFETTWNNVPKEFHCDTEVRLKQHGKYIKQFPWLDYKYTPSDTFDGWSK